MLWGFLIPREHLLRRASSEVIIWHAQLPYACTSDSIALRECAYTRRTGSQLSVWTRAVITTPQDGYSGDAYVILDSPLKGVRDL